jgi:hypothetical protein
MACFLYICRDKKLILHAETVYLALLLSMGLSTSSYAQFGFSHEVGIIAGPVAFQSDWGAL